MSRHIAIELEGRKISRSNGGHEIGTSEKGIGPFQFTPTDAFGETGFDVHGVAGHQEIVLYIGPGAPRVDVLLESGQVIRFVYDLPQSLVKRISAKIGALGRTDPSVEEAADPIPLY